MSEHTETPMIRTRGLTKHFTRHKKTVEAVRGLDLDVHRGELVAFLGPNGAGKSTTLRMLTTLIAPTSGTAEVAGYDVVTGQRDVRRSIGYVGQGNAAGHTQRGRDELVSQARAHGLTRQEASRRADELLEAFDLTEHAGRPVSTLSGGQRRRLDIAIGLVHTPRLLFLDEPSTGLDPQNRANLQEQIKRLHAENGTTIVLTTHYLEEADAIADRVVVIDHGLVIADDTAAALKSGLGDLVTLGFGTRPRRHRGRERSRPAPGGRQRRARRQRGHDPDPRVAPRWCRRWSRTSRQRTRRSGASRSPARRSTTSSSTSPGAACARATTPPTTPPKEQQHEHRDRVRADPARPSYPSSR